jgi:hypothetical protein
LALLDVGVRRSIASFASLSKLASQLVEGRLLLRRHDKDARNAPAEVKKLVDELEILNKTAEGVERLFGMSTARKPVLHVGFLFTFFWGIAQQPGS